jgi:DNA-binding response OmpR family regulator
MVGKRKLLIADDDKLLHQMYADGLGEDYDILHAYDGADALTLAVEHTPDVILLDIMMPLLDGRTVCRKMKENSRTKDTKIIMVTGRGEQSDRLIGFEVGADEYVDKPVSLAYLKRKIGKLLP